MIIFINTTSHGKAVLALISHLKVKKSIFSTKSRLSEALPGRIQGFMRKNRVRWQDLDSIAVVKGPGSFVGVRTGVAYANALSQSLNIPVLGLLASDLPGNLGILIDYKFKQELVTPAYGSLPNITKGEV